MTSRSQRVRSRLAACARTLARSAAAPVLAATVCVALLSASMWKDGSTSIEDVSSTLMGIRKLVSGDSEHYLAIADALREGDFAMTHVEPTGASDRAHRQPGFPALLAVAGKLGADGAPALARVNLGVLVASLWLTFFAARLATRSSLAALLAVAVLYDARFLLDIATGRLLTEPLFVAVALGAVGAGLSYLTRPAAASLLLAAGMASAAYLVRVNGIFLAAALAAVMVAADVLRARRAEPDLPSPDLVLRLPLAAYAVAFALFVVVAMPSWVPRAVYTGNPVYHGYLTNYLWVDHYSQAHVPGPPQYTMSTYVAEHSVSDAAGRLWYGMRRVFYETPRDKYGPAASAAVLIALVVVFALRDVPGMLLACAAVMQAMPLAWTALANPARRLPATALLPFAVLLVAAAVAAALRRARARQRS